MTGRLTTPLCAKLGIDVPIIQAPIGSATTPALVAAVASAGGLGMLATTWSSLDAIEQGVVETRSLTDRPFGVNFVLAFEIRERLSRALDLGVRIVSTAWGDPASVRPQLRDAGVTHFHTCGSVNEARQAAEVGVDVIVAQGWEAGGHVLGSTASMALVPAVVDAVWPVPVIAAGGIGDGRGLAAALVLGAQAAWVGTRFLTASEAFTHDDYRLRVVDADPEEAIHTTCFDGGWPDAPHRALLNETLNRWQAAGRPMETGRPGEGDVVAVDESGREWLRYDDMMPLPGMTGDLDAMALYAGQSAGVVHNVRPAAAIVSTMIAEAEAALARVAEPTARES